MRSVLLLPFFVACTGSPADDTAGGIVTDPLAYLHGTAALAEVSGGACPDFTSGGDVDITSGGEARTVKVILPESGGEGKPVLFAWYPLNGSARWLVDALDLRDYADANDAIVVVPTADGTQDYEWHFLDEVAGNPDLALFDDVRSCLYEQLQVDLGRVASTGFSAGAVWTSYLSLYRGDTLATVLTFSGGTGVGFIPYETPAGPFPALLDYGGETDTYANVHFDRTTEDYASNLTADGHFVVWCNHDGGHALPADARDQMDAWIPAHAYGEASPFVGDVSALPEYCSVYVE